MWIFLVGTIILIFGFFEFRKFSENSKKLEEKIRGELEKFEKASAEFIDRRQFEELNAEFRKLKNKVSKIVKSNLLGFLIFRRVEIREFSKLAKDLEREVEIRNEEFIARETEKFKEVFEDIDGKKLDEQQIRAVITNDNYNLVLAGAGSGKTLTISAKVKYLVDCKGVSSDDILLISFTRAAAREMEERISEKMGIEIESKTFHKLGLEIIKNHEFSRPDVVESDFLDKIIKKILSGKGVSNEIKQKILLFLGCYMAAPRDLENFDSLGEYISENRSISLNTLRGRIGDISKIVEDKINLSKTDLETIKGERVKSIEEVLIANFLFLNGVNYFYEKEYPFSTGDRYRKRYRPDFYLPDYDIYLEHFGVNEDFETPWLSKIEQKKYLDGISWKRKIHQENDTKLLETYSFYNSKGILYSKLEKMLKNSGVKFEKMNYSKVIEALFKNDQYEFDDIRKLISTFVNLFKSSGRGESDFAEIQRKINEDSSEFFKTRGNLFIDVAEVIFGKYQDALERENAIDFNDMINDATKIVKSGATDFGYKYIIIDEYQDIASGRFKLVEALIAKTGAKLMCVGDDWQSIYRFSGSDLALFTDFGSQVGFYRLLKIEQTYRNSQELIDIAGRFVMKNPQQFEKNLRSNLRQENPIEIVTYKFENSAIGIRSAVAKIISEIVRDFGVDKTIMILGRNNFDVSSLEDENDRRFKVVKSRNGISKVIFKQIPEVEIKFLTVHKSKGLEADNVILLNLKNDIFGFPNKIVDDPILSYVLTNKDAMIHAEERRLFYVAMTRTKNKTFLVAPDKNPSLFAEELANNFHLDLDKNKLEQTKCPKCKTGKLIIRTGANGDFVGCENYPGCDYTNKNLEILHHSKRCSRCGDFMVVRKRKSDGHEFWGCSNFPECTHTERK